jgi:hypothetical protein
LLRTRNCGGESRQLEDYPRAFVQLRQREGQVRPFGGHLHLGTGPYVGARYVVLLAIAAENDWRLSSSTSTSTRSGNRTRPTTTTTRAAASAARSTAAANIQAPNIALAHGSVPGGLDLTGFRVDCDAVVDAIIDENVRFGATAERSGKDRGVDTIAPIWAG